MPAVRSAAKLTLTGPYGVLHLPIRRERQIDDGSHMTARSLAISCLLGTEALLLAQRPDALRFGGRIVDVLGDPVPAAAIELVIDGRVAQRTFADGEGIYQLAATAGDLLVHARGKARIRLPWRGPTTARVRNVVLQDAARLTGIVRDHRNRPLANAYVVAAYAEGSRRTRSDGRGRYQFDGVPLTRVIVSALGTSTFAQQTVRLTGSSVCDLRLPIEGIPMRTVQVAGLPAAAVRDAFVDVVTPNMALLPDRGRTSLRADGSAEFMLTSFALVQAHAPGHRLTPRGRLVSGTTDAVRFVAHPAPEPGVRLRGKVRVARGPIPAGEQLVVRDVHGTDLAVATIDDRGSLPNRDAADPRPVVPHRRAVRPLGDHRRGAHGPRRLHVAAHRRSGGQDRAVAATDARLALLGRRR